ncbi:MAG: hypothetical protein U1E19_01675, partial [Rhodoblastus sp.]
MIVRAFSVAPPSGIDADTLGRLRAAQIAVIARYAPAMMAVNFFNALVLAAALSINSEPATTFA